MLPHLVQLWDLTIICLFPPTWLAAHAIRYFLRDGVKAPLAIGDVLLEDGSLVKGFVGESYGVVGAPDVSSFGGWRAYLQSQESS